MTTLTARAAELLAAGQAKNNVVSGDDLQLAYDLQDQGLVALTGVRPVYSKTTGDGHAALARYRAATASKDFSGITAAEVNEWLATLPPWGAP
jgi:hypothetical protein